MRSSVLLLFLAAACAPTPEKASAVATPPTASRLTEPPVDAASTSPPAEQRSKLVPDEAVGALLARLSETPGDFPSENYVSNEPSLLDVMGALDNPNLRGRAYVGVGPEQNYTYLALLEPKVAYIVDIRRGNFLEHMIFRGCFEAGTTRAEFLSALLARPAPVRGELTTPGFGALDTAFRSSSFDVPLRDAGIARTKALLDRLGIAHSKTDDATITRVHAAFATHGLSIAYTMTRGPGEYTTLSENLALRDPKTGEPSSFLATEASYTRVRRLVMENRVLPVVGDFGGAHALRAVADDMRDRGTTLGVFYGSNVEQYLFDGKKHRALVSSIDAMPHDDASRFVRVWFDQSASAKATHPTHRTTQLTVPVNDFLERAAQRPFRSYGEVVAHSRSATP